MFTVVYKPATFQSFTGQIVHVLSAYETQMRMFSHSAIFPAKFSDIFRFCGHNKLLYMRKWLPHDDPPSLNTLLSAECTHHICQQVGLLTLKYKYKYN